MSINFGIIGLARSGKTTIFNALTAGKAETTGRGGEITAPHLGVARVPEPRLRVLDGILHPHRLVPVEARYIDIGASVKALAQDKGLGAQLLNQLSTVDTLICVVRAFKDDSVPHPRGSIDVDRDIADLNMELVFSDLAIMERRLERLETSLKGAKPGERHTLLQEQEILKQFKTALENDRPLRELTIDPVAVRYVTNYQFLTAKPMLIVVNIGEDQLAEAEALEAQLSRRYSGNGLRVITLCGRLEMELAQLEESAAQELRASYGMKQSGLERTIKASYDLSSLITFFTTASNEVRAWAIRHGTTAVKAAGKIHSDMEKGFIRAECVSYDDLVRCGSLTEARKRGLLRLEGKEYTVQDGDIITFLFNV
ncbi:MAG: redox-regulated ATPase YchF [Dehalococcoidales bacterium]|nr:redox-regulated ATPase YchF [Dehalococcoidales bacterium]